MYKVCCTCKQEKLLTDFRKDARKRDGVQSSCKVCARAYHSSAYVQRYGDDAKAHTRKRYNAAKEYVDTYKATHPCEICGESEVVCLDFHHLDPAQKDFGISAGLNRKMDFIKSEIDKCMVVCKNCHAKVHAGVIDIGSATQLVMGPLLKSVEC